MFIKSQFIKSILLVTVVFIVVQLSIVSILFVKDLIHNRDSNHSFIGTYEKSIIFHPNFKRVAPLIYDAQNEIFKKSEGLIYIGKDYIVVSNTNDKDIYEQRNLIIKEKNNDLIIMVDYNHKNRNVLSIVNENELIASQSINNSGVETQSIRLHKISDTNLINQL